MDTEAVRAAIEHQLNLIQMFHPPTANHCRGVGKLMMAYAHALGEDEEIYELAGLAHDIGKFDVINVILENDSRVLLASDSELWQIKEHVRTGWKWLNELDISIDDQLRYELLSAITYHHERWDGNGYPLGMRGYEIPQIARVANVCCSYDAMASGNRNWREPFMPARAMSELQKYAGAQFDREVVQHFCALEEINL